MLGSRKTYRNQYSGSPWQQGGPPIGISGYGQSYGGYGISSHYAMTNSGYSRNQANYSLMYGGGMSQMGGRYGGGSSQSRRSMNDYSIRERSRGQMQPKRRVPQRSPVSGPRSKRPRLESDSGRNKSKSWGRRDSKGGAKSRRDQSDGEKDSKLYNPAEPTDDASDIDCDDFESWKSSSGDESETTAKNAKEQEAVDGEDKPDKADEANKTEDAKKPLVCYVCKIKCSNPERFRRHMGSHSHKARMDNLLVLQREKVQVLEAGTKASQQVENQDSSKKRTKKRGNWCTVCDCAFSGNFLAHRRAKEHRRNRDRKYPKCRPCKIGFQGSEEYKEHCKKEDHKVKSAEFHYLKSLASGSDDDEAAVKPIIVETPVKEEKDDTEDKPKEEEKKSDEVKEDEEASKVKKEEEDKDSAKPEGKKTHKSEEVKPVGQTFVRSVHGYYCKLCHKFFKDVTVARVKHCRSIMHNEAFKKAMEKAMEQEEERQKLSDEQEKLEQAAADAARLAAEIAAVEKAAKEAVKKEVAEKKAAQKASDAKMDESTDQSGENAAVEKMETSDVSGITNGEKEDMEVTGEEGKAGIEGTLEETKGGEAAKEETEPVPQPASVAAAEEEKSVKIAESDGQGDEEVEEAAKEEPVSSPATKGGRGRGRGRSQSRGRGRKR